MRKQLRKQPFNGRGRKISTKLLRPGDVFIAKDLFMSYEMRYTKLKNYKFEDPDWPEDTYVVAAIDEDNEYVENLHLPAYVKLQCHS